MQIIESDKFNWAYIKEPNADDVLEIQNNYKLHPLVIEEFSTPTLRPKAAEYDNCLYLAIHVPLFDTDNKTTYPAEVDIVVCPNTLITAHDKDIYQLTDFFNTLQENKKKRALYMSKSPAQLLYYILELLLESCFPKLDHVSQKLDRVEEGIFSGHEKEMVVEISLIKRDILNFRRTMKPQRTVFESLAQKNYNLIEPDLRPYYQDLVGTNIRVWNTLESSKETIESLESTNNSLLSNKLNMTMRVLTIFSAIMLPLTVYSNIMSMTLRIPLQEDPLAFWIHVAIMLVIAAFTFVLFKIKKWL